MTDGEMVYVKAQLIMIAKACKDGRLLLASARTTRFALWILTRHERRENVA